MDLASFLCSTRRFQTTEPRDKIFALIGLTKDASEYMHMTDYAKPIMYLYTDNTQTLRDILLLRTNVFSSSQV